MAPWTVLIETASSSVSGSSGSWTRLVSSAWKETPSGRPMKFYSLTGEGERQLEVEQTKWEHLAWAIGLVLRQA